MGYYAALGEGRHWVAVQRPRVNVAAGEEERVHILKLVRGSSVLRWELGEETRS